MAVLAAVLVAAPSFAADQTFFFSGTVDTSGLDAVAPGTSFSGTYTVDDAAVDSEALTQLGVYSTGQIFLTLDGIGTVTLDQTPTTRVWDNQPLGFGLQVDSLSISAAEGSRSLSFTNAIDAATLVLQTSVNGTPTTLTSDSLVAALAVPFANWEEGSVVLTVSATGDASCTALVSSCPIELEIEAVEHAYTLTVGKDGGGTGTVTSSPLGIDCGATCAADFGGTVVLTATADAGSVFSGWTGCDSVSGNQCTVDVTADRAVTATFEIAEYTLTVNKAGAGTGTVTSAPAGIDCGATCSADFNGMVTLAAVADAGSVFSGWTGCDSVSGDLCEIFVDDTATVTASFDVEEQVAAVPTVSEWGLMLLALVLVGFGIGFLARNVA